VRAFEFFTARNSRHAVELLAEHGKSAKLLAGGTDLLVELKSSSEVPAAVIDISRAEDLKAIAVTDEGLSIGALVTHTAIMRSALIRDIFPALIDAAHTIGAVQTRNLGTLGGNLVTAVPSVDSGPTLVALDALVTIAGPAGKRRMLLLDFFVGPRKTALKPGELLVEIVIPKENLSKPVHFLKMGLRKGQALALVNAAASLWIDGKKNTCASVRIALGAVAPTVVRATTAEKFLDGRAATPENFAEAGRLAIEDARPISDMRASAEYRKDLVAVLTRRALAAACAQANAAQATAKGAKK
jgi:CO/xanthine dehydrogenase FAD-binding subunit